MGDGVKDGAVLVVVLMMSSVSFSEDVLLWREKKSQHFLHGFVFVFYLSLILLFL